MSSGIWRRCNLMPLHIFLYHWRFRHVLPPQYCAGCGEFTGVPQYYCVDCISTIQLIYVRFRCPVCEISWVALGTKKSQGVYPVKDSYHE